MALSKERKNELVTQYVDWTDSCQALIVTEYKGLSVKIWMICVLNCVL